MGEVAPFSADFISHLTWCFFGHRTDESDLIAESVGLEELKLKNLTTGKAREILAKAAKWKIPHAK